MPRQSVRWSCNQYYLGKPAWRELLDIPQHIRAVEVFAHAVFKQDARGMLEDRGMRGMQVEDFKRDHSNAGTALEEAGLFVPGVVLIQLAAQKDRRVLRIDPGGEAVHVATWQYEQDMRRKPSGLYLLVHE